MVIWAGIENECFSCIRLLVNWGACFSCTWWLVNFCLCRSTFSGVRWTSSVCWLPFKVDSKANQSRLRSGSEKIELNWLVLMYIAMFSGHTTSYRVFKLQLLVSSNFSWSWVNYSHWLTSFQGQLWRRSDRTHQHSTIKKMELGFSCCQ